MKTKNNIDNKDWSKIIRELDTKLKLFGLISLVSSAAMLGAIPLIPETERIYAFLFAFIFLLSVFGGMIYVLHKEKSEPIEKETQTRELPSRLDKGNTKLTNGSLHGSLKGHREIKRLEIQSDGNMPLDLKAFTTAIEKFNEPKNIYAIDIGCGDGKVTYSRFSRFPEFVKVYGIDKDADTLNNAILENQDKDRFDFRVFDVENNGFSDFVRNLDPSFKDGVDLVFCALLLSHLNDPQTLINKIKNLVKPGGVVIFRGSDDGTKICHPNPNGLLENVITLTKSIPGVSDRDNARKLYSQLLKAKFRNIETLYHVRDTVNKSADERSEFYFKSFSYRSRYIDLAINQGHIFPAESELRKALSDLEDLFSEPDFYYMEMSYVFIASV